MSVLKDGLAQHWGVWKADPVSFAEHVLGITLEPFQILALNLSVLFGILNCSRQSGKTLVMAIKAVHLAHLVPGSTIGILCPTRKQCGEVFEKVRFVLDRLGLRLRGDGHNKISARFPNGSRIVCLSAGEKFRGISAVDLLLIDEAAEVPDSAYDAVTPTLATTAYQGSGGLWLISTPKGKQGFFWRAWSEGGDDWYRLSVPASEISRISPEFLERERRQKGDLMFRQEYCCEFVDTPDSLFREDLIRRAISKNVPRLQL